MARRSHHSNDPSDGGGSPLTPDAVTKVEFGRRLQRLLHEKGWRQSDLKRATKDVDPKNRGIGGDAISRYINALSAPTPTSLELLCKALGTTREELFPNALMMASADEVPSFEIKVASGHPGQAWVRVNRMMSFGTASKIGSLLADEDGLNVE